MKFVIKGRLPSLNDYIATCRTNKYAGNKLKQDDEKRIKYAIREAKLTKAKKYPVSLHITWYEQDMRRDEDNITYAVKFIQDALVKEGILQDDSRKYVLGNKHEVLVDKDGYIITDDNDEPIYTL